MSFRGTVVVARRGSLPACCVVCRDGSTCLCQGAAEIGAGVGVACVVFSEWCVCGSGTRTSRTSWSSRRSLEFRLFGVVVQCDRLVLSCISVCKYNMLSFLHNRSDRG